jgi:hypothetical protein
MLSHRWIWRETLSFNQPMPHATRAIYWRDYLEDVSPCHLRANRSSPGWPIDVIGQPPPIADITEDTYRGLAETIRSEMKASGTHILAVNTSSPRHRSKEAFRRLVDAAAEAITIASKAERETIPKFPNYE